MDELKAMKAKFLSIIKKKKPADTATALPVRVNLPAELGGGFTMLMCQLRAGQSTADFIKSLIAMLQNTNSVLLRATEYGLTPHTERDEDGLDADGRPAVFLKPDSLLADAFDDEEELNLDLRRLKPLKKEETVPAAASNGTGTETNGSPAPPATPANTTPSQPYKPFKIPQLPTPPAQTVLHYTCLSKLKRLKPPADPPPEVLVVSTFVPPCSLPAHLAKSLPEGMQTLSLTSSLQARASSAAAAALAGSSTAAVAASFSSTPSAPSKKDLKAAEQLQRKIDEYAAHVYDMLLLRGIGEDPHVKLQMAAAQASARAAPKGERIGTASSQDDKIQMWGGWEDHIETKAKDENKLEVPLIFVSTKKVPEPLPKKFDVTADCFVITTQRCVQVTSGAITEELALGSDSGNILKLPKDTDDGSPGKCPIHLLVKNAIELEREEALLADPDGAGENGHDESKEDGGTNGTDVEDNDGSSSASARRSRARKNSQGGKQRLVSFFVPNPDIAGFLEEYLMYFQEKSSLESQLGLIEQARLDRIEHYRTERCLRGWTYLLKSLVAPIIFGPLRQPVYENSIKQVLAKVMVMDIPQVKLTSLKLVEFRIPELDATALTAQNKDGDQIPSLRLADYIGHPHHTYVFDIFWSAPSFYIKVEISGKKIVSFKLELEMKGVEVRGSLRLRSSPYEPEKAAVSFISVPQLSFGVGSHVIVGTVKLPFQRAIEKLIYTQIQAAIEGGLKENVVGDKWQSIAPPVAVDEKSRLSLQLDRWWGMAQYPFKYDGTDDEEMMSLALVVTTQAEKSLSDTVKEMRTNRDKMQACLGQRSGPSSSSSAPPLSYNGGSSDKPTKRSSTSSKEKDRDREREKDTESNGTPPMARKKSVSKLQAEKPLEDDDESESAPPPKKKKDSTTSIDQPKKKDSTSTPSKKKKGRIPDDDEG